MSDNSLNNGNVTLTRFAGGARRGICYQLDGPTEDGSLSYVQYTAVEAACVALAILRDQLEGGVLVTWPAMTKKQGLALVEALTKKVEGL